jgi:hypothetical protein
MNVLRIVVGLGAALCLSACATAYVGKPYERSATEVKSIALADDSVPEKAIAFEVASVGSNFGLIGALVDLGIQSSRQDAVNDALTGVGFDAEAKLESRIATELGAQGYEVAPLPDQPRAKRAFLQTYPTGGTADAYLDVVVQSYGYLSAGAGKPFRPTVTANIRLVSAKDPSKTLMENLIAYNAMAPQKGVVTLAPNPAYEFKNRADMLADPTQLAAGIEDALNQVAGTAAKLLK